MKLTIGLPNGSMQQPTLAPNSRLIERAPRYILNLQRIR